MMRVMFRSQFSGRPLDGGPLYLAAATCGAIYNIVCHLNAYLYGNGANIDMPVAKVVLDNVC